jgi:hypothetical protein
MFPKTQSNQRFFDSENVKKLEEYVVNKNQRALENWFVH